MEIQTPVLLAYAIEDSTDIFRISGGGGRLNTPNPTPLGKPLVYVMQFWWHIPVPNIQWKTPDDGQRNCPKPVEFLGKNKFGKLVFQLVLLKINLLLCTVTW